MSSRFPGSHPPRRLPGGIVAPFETRSRARGRVLDRFHEVSRTSQMTFWVYLLYTAVEFLNLGARVGAIGAMRPTVLLFAALGALLLFQGAFTERKDDSRSTRLMMGLLAYIVLTLPFVEWPGSVLRGNLLDFLRVAVFFFFTVQIVDTLPRLKQFLIVAIGLTVFRILEPLYLHITTGYWGSAAHGLEGAFLERLAGAPTDVINPNGLGFLIIIALPFLHFLLFKSRIFAYKLLYLALLGPLLYALILTGSRSAMAGLIVVLAMLVLKSQHRAVFCAAILAGFVLAIPHMSADQTDRFASLFSTDGAHAATREGRIDGVIADFRTGFNRPLFGHGVGTGFEAKFNVRGGTMVPHNLYAEAFIELGIVGLALYVALIWSFVKNTMDAKRAVRAMPSRVRGLDGDLFIRLSDAIQVWVAMCIVFSFAHYGVSEFHWYMVGGISVVIARLAARRTSWERARHARPR